MSAKSPIYLKSYEDGTLKNKADTAAESLKNCTLCPRRCSVDRGSNELGICQTGVSAKVASFNAHFGEEAPLVGENGSGTIFFSHCNLLCNFCQNYDISHGGWGEEVSSSQLAEVMLHLQKQGCHNINLVTPSHVVPQILAALVIAAGKGLRLPIVYNSSGYDRVETLRLLDGVVDIYMPDFKFWDSRVAEETCRAGNYPEVARKALREMHAQVGDLYIDSEGLACHGLLVRHLVMPQNMAGTRQVLEFIAKEISPNTYLNIMSQYRPCGEAYQIEALRTAVSTKEFRRAIEDAKALGFCRIDGRAPTFRL